LHIIMHIIMDIIIIMHIIMAKTSDRLHPPEDRSQFFSLRTEFMSELKAVVHQTIKTSGYRGFYTGFSAGCFVPALSWASHTFLSSSSSSFF